MTRSLPQFLSRRQGRALAITLITAATLVFSFPATAHDNDHHGHGHHKKHHHKKHSNRAECRTIMQKYDVNKYVTLSEYGKACRERDGDWRIVSDMRFPFHKSRFYFVYGHRLVPADFNGYERDWKENNHGWNSNGDDDRGNHDNRDYGYNDKKYHKNHKKDHFFD